MVVDDPKTVDMILVDKAYRWERVASTAYIPSVENAQTWLKEGKYVGILKSWGEFFDDLVTRQWLSKTDLYIYPTADEDGRCSVTLCGISRMATSTKEYATIESEIYVDAIMENISRISKNYDGIHQIERQTARILYPRIAFDEWRVTDEMAKSAVFSVRVKSGFSKAAADLVARSLQQFSPRLKKASAASDFGKRMLVLAGQLAIASLLSTLGLDWLAEIIKNY